MKHDSAINLTIIEHYTQNLCGNGLKEEMKHKGALNINQLDLLNKKELYYVER